MCEYIGKRMTAKEGDALYEERYKKDGSKSTWRMFWFKENRFW